MGADLYLGPGSLFNCSRGLICVWDSGCISTLVEVCHHHGILAVVKSNEVL